MGQGQQRPSRRLRPRRGRRAAARSPTSTRDRRRGLQQPTRTSSAPRAGWTWRTSCSSPPACSPTTNGSPPRSGASTSASSSTSSRTSRRSSRPCSTSGWAAATSSASSATRRRPSTPSPAPTPRYLRDFPAKFPATTSIELVRNYRSTPQVVAVANTLLERYAEPRRRAAAQQPVRPRGHLLAPPRRGGRGRGRRRAHRRLRDGGRRRARSPCCSASTPSPRRSRTRSPAAASPTSSAARPVLRPPRGPRGGDPAARHRPVRRRPAADDWTTRSAPCSPAWAGAPRRPTARGRTRDRWESLQALVDQATEFAAGRRQRPQRASSTTSTAGPRAARPGRRRRHPGHAPRRQGPRVGLRLRDRPPGGHAAVLLRRVAHRGRGGAPAALRRHDPRPARPRPLLEPGPQPGRAGLTQALPLPRPAPPSRRARLRRARPAAAWPTAASAASR